MVTALLSPVFIPRSFGNDFNGDGGDDIGLFRPLSGLWAIKNGRRAYFGAAGDYAAPGDYDGDRTAEICVFRPTAGLWSIRGKTRIYFGRTGDIAVSRDYNGDGRCDIAIFRPFSGMWAVRNQTRFYFGKYGDTPIPGDYDGNGTIDFSVYRPSLGLWAVRGGDRLYFGDKNDRPVPADYNGDGRIDMAVFRDDSGLWALYGQSRFYFGSVTDLPQPADYNGDGNAEAGIYRERTGLWAVRNGPRTYFGGEGDIPVAGQINWKTHLLPRLGIQAKDLYFTDKMPKIAETGTGFTRYNHISWDLLQSSSDADLSEYALDTYDTDLSAPGQYGLSTIVTIGDVPEWAGLEELSLVDRHTGPIREEYLDDFAGFLYQIVTRYKNPPYNIKFWELFNEPDGIKSIYDESPTYTNAWGYYGDRYARMLRYAYPAIKAADPEAQVLIGGLAYDSFVDNGGYFYRWFINDVLLAGGGSYFDIMNFHYYYWAGETWGDIGGKKVWLEDLLSSYGSAKPIICSEAGIWGYDDPYYLELQACYVPIVYSRGLSAGLLAVDWFPLGTMAGDEFEGGLLSYEGDYPFEWGVYSEKPAYEAYKILAAELTDYEYAGTLAETGLEGYFFRPETGGRDKLVLWKTDENGEQLKDFEYSEIRVVDKLGNEVLITDGGAGDLDQAVNGKIRINIDSGPRYIELFP